MSVCMCRIFLFCYQICNVKTKKAHKVRFLFSTLTSKKRMHAIHGFCNIPAPGAVFVT